METLSPGVLLTNSLFLRIRNRRFFKFAKKAIDAPTYFAYPYVETTPVTTGEWYFPDVVFHQILLQKTLIFYGLQMQSAVL